MLERLLRALLGGGVPAPAGRCGIAAGVLLGHVTGFALQEQSQPAVPPAVAAQRYADPCARFPLLMGPLTEWLDQDEKSRPPRASALRGLHRSPGRRDRCPRENRSSAPVTCTTLRDGWFPIESTGDPMAGQWQELGTPGGLEAHVHRPAGEVRGAVVVCSELYGVNAYLRGVCAELAEHGYAAVAPDFYWRNARRTELGYEAEEREAGLVLMKALDRDELVADAAEALAAARELAGGRGVAFLGTSMGGHIAVRAATELRFELAAVFYPGWLLNSGFPLVGPVPPLETAERIAANGVHLLGFCGELDHILPQEEWQEAERRLTAAGVGHELVTYPGARHGFAADRPADHDAEATADAWRRVYEALARHL
ncbi:dienelactone hydrolase family protein [Kitasatospora cineracea]|uniref:dienelactone hydrolase family protein n=1 Tax=Kitasatospora cineracea TaxID=88074 RepID=UPI0036AF40AA